MGDTTRYLVLNPRKCTYEIVTGPPTVKDLALANGMLNVEINGTYISHRCPDLQVIELTDCDNPPTVYDLT